MIQLHKYTDKKNPNNYCPIPLTRIPSKMSANIILSNLVNFLESNSYLNSCEHGFVKHSHPKPSFYVSDLNFIFDCGSPAGCIFLDLWKLFDKVPHSLLLQKLAGVNIDTSVLNWIISVLGSPSQSLFCNDTESRSLQRLVSLKGLFRLSSFFDMH